MARARTILVSIAAGWAVGLVAPPTVAAPGTGTHFLYFVRHGSYDSDAGAGVGDRASLTPLGREQARLLGARLASLAVRPEVFVTSPYPRARETAEEIGALLGATPVVDTLLHECIPRTRRADIMKDHDPAEIAACDSNLVAAWTRYVVPTPEADRHDLLVCHGNVIRWFVSRVLCGDATHWGTMDIGNASITVLAVRPDGRAKLVSFSDVGHLPVEKQTWTGRGAGWGSSASK